MQAEDGDDELHGGGDPGLVNALYDEMTSPPGSPLTAGLDSTVHSHLLAFAAEEARVTGRSWKVPRLWLLAHLLRLGTRIPLVVPKG